MKINFVLPTADLTGGIRVVVMLARQLERSGHQVTLVSPPPPAPSLREKQLPVRTLSHARRASASIDA
jgi:hypothetical protein